MEGMVGAIEEDEGAIVEEVERGTTVEVVTTEFANSEGEVLAIETEEIRPQVVEIETSSEIKGIVIEKVVPLGGIGEVSTLLTPKKKRKLSSVGGELSRRRRTRASWKIEVVSIEIPIFTIET